VFPNNLTMQVVCKKWFFNKNANILQLVAGCKKMNSGGTITLGSTSLWYRRSIVFVKSHTGRFRLKAQADTAVHEIGHQFDVDHGPNNVHVDSFSVGYRNHDNTDECVMCYKSLQTDGCAEFCIDNCIKTIRKSPDQLSKGNN
jgi:hypothetical protein